MKGKSVVFLLVVSLLISMFSTIVQAPSARAIASDSGHTARSDSTDYAEQASHKERKENQTITSRHRITASDLKKMKEKIGVCEDPNDYNPVVNGHGTGLCPPTEEEWAQIAANAYVVDTVERAEHDPSLGLSSSVDYSTSSWFPPIGNQDGEGSCVSWAITYYMKTFQEAKEHGWDLTGAYWEEGQYPTPEYQDMIMSPAFTYHLTNGGENTGTYYYPVMNLVCSIGACTWQKMPWAPSDQSTWPPENAWRQAPYYRGAPSGYETMTVGTDEGIVNLKTWIDSGNLAVISVDANQYYTKLSSNDVWNLSYTGGTTNHANTIVGYDDHFTYIEGGVLTAGAFKVANSWGVGGWEHVPDGFYWISYEAMKQSIGYVMFYQDRPSYSPQLTTTFQIDHALRGECTVTIGMGSHDSPTASKEFTQYINMWIGGGNYPFCSNNIVFDITEFMDVVPSVCGQRFFLSVYDGGTLTTGTILYFSVASTVSPNPPVTTVNGEYVYADLTMDTPLEGKVSMATSSDGYLYVVFEEYSTIDSRQYIVLLRSADGGLTWSNFTDWNEGGLDVHNPSMAIDPVDNRIYVAYEREWGYPWYDHDICCLVIDPATMSRVAHGVDEDFDDDRYPSITCEYSWGTDNWQYISYEYVYNYDDRDLMFVRSTDNEHWTDKQTVCGLPEEKVHAQSCITNAQNVVYIASREAEDYASVGDIRVDRSYDFGQTWTASVEVDGVGNNCAFPSIAATHGGNAVVVAFEFDWSASNTDVFYSYSADQGWTWSPGGGLIWSGENETAPAITVDGGGSIATDVQGSFHLVCRVGDYASPSSYLMYTHASCSTPSAWSTPMKVLGAFTEWGALYAFNYNLAITTQYRAGEARFCPCIAYFRLLYSWHRLYFRALIPRPANAFWLEPDLVQIPPTIGYKFNVTAWVNVATNTHLWQFKLLFNSTYFRVTRIGYTAGETSEFFLGHTTIPCAPIFDNDAGWAAHGECLLGADYREPGYASLSWVEFEVKAIPPGNQSVCLTDLDSETYLLDPNMNIIPLDPHTLGYCTKIIHTLPIVSIDPLTKTVVNAQEFTINVTLDYAERLFAYEFSLGFNNSVLNATSVEYTGYLGTGGDVCDPIIIIDNTGGYVSFAISRLVLPGVDGGGNLATVHFAAIAVGTSPVDLYDTVLAADYGVPMDHGTDDGEVTVLPATNLVVESIVVLDQGCTVYANDTYADGVTFYYVPVEVTVKNDEAESAGAFSVLLAVGWQDGGIWEDWTEWRVSGLAADENVTLTYNWHPIHTGNYSLVALVDYYKEVSETDEADNMLVLPDFLVALMGDVYTDHVNNVLDITQVGLAWHSHQGDAIWNIHADLNHDGTINILDIIRVTLHWHQTW